MFPLPIAGLALIGRIILSRISNSSDRYPTPYKSRPLFKLRPRTDYSTDKIPNAANPIQTLAKGLTSSLSQVRTILLGEDYNAVIKEFLPAGARLLKPQYPANSQEFIFADLDGDSQDELITSYKHDNRIKTLVLKKQDEQWHKAAEANHTYSDGIRYTGAADITGEGKKQLLLGFPSEEKKSTLHGYSLENNSLSKLFSQSYHKLEVLEQPKTGEASPKARLAVWNKPGTDPYNIELLGWNGLQLEPVESPAPYYLRKVVPLYAQKVKRAPYSPSNWYDLAQVLEKAEAYRDTLTAVEVGTELDRNSEFAEKFTRLKNRIAQKGL